MDNEEKIKELEEKCRIDRQERHVLRVFKFRLSPLQISKRKRKKLDHRR